jgi:hypothetical protein
MIKPTSRPDVNKIAINVNSGTGVTPITGKFHHFTTQNTTSPSARNTPITMTDDKIVVIN